MEQTIRHRLCIATAAGFALLAVATPSFAQQAAPIAANKSDAILGGPNRLAAVMAAQASGTPLQSRAALLPVVDAAADRPLFAVATRFIIPAPFARPVDTPSLEASPERPDVFNSVAMSVARTPLDAKWSRVGSATVVGSAARFATALRDRAQHERIEAINAYVNSRVTFVDDSREFGVPDRWSAAADTLGRGRGDCEDYALAKLAMLRRAGFADHDLYFVVLKDLSRRADHAVLVVRSGGRFLVLDNGTDRLLNSAEIKDYRPILTFSAGQRFTHGYRRSATPPVVLASTQALPRQPGQVAISTAAGIPSSPFASR